MTPLYFPGEYLLCKKSKSIRSGDIVIAQTKTYGKILKRVRKVRDEDVLLEGLHPSSVTTEEIGPVKKDDILYRVIFPRRKNRRKGVDNEKE